MVEREPPIKYGKVTSFDADLRDADRVVEHLEGIGDRYSRQLRLMRATLGNARTLQAKIRKAKDRGREYPSVWTLERVSELIAELEDDIRCAVNAIEHGLPDLAARVASGEVREAKPLICRTKMNAMNRRARILEALAEPMTLRQMAASLPFSVPVIRHDVRELVSQALVESRIQSFTTGLGGKPPRVYRKVTAQIEARA